MTDLLKGPLHYPEDPPETPYDRAGLAWERRVGTAAAQIKSWQGVTYVAGAFALVFGIATVVLGLRSKPLPIIVRVGDHGGVEHVYRGIASSEMAPRENEIRYFVADLVRRLRSLPLDPVLAKQNWRKAYAFLTQNAATKMSQWARQENPLGKLGEETVQVRVLSVVPLSGESRVGTYQVRWEETRFGRKGVQLARRTYTGLFTVRIVPPTDEAAIFANPLGLFVEAFEWSRDL